jgi:hypothetical protein
MALEGHGLTGHGLKATLVLAFVLSISCVEMGWRE